MPVPAAAIPMQMLMMMMQVHRRASPARKHHLHPECQLMLPHLNNNVALRESKQLCIVHAQAA